jgi:hypothetical protein
MSSFVSLFLGMTLIYFIYISISYKVVLACLSDVFMCSSFVHQLEACVMKIGYCSSISIKQYS